MDEIQRKHKEPLVYTHILFRKKKSIIVLNQSENEKNNIIWCYTWM